MKTLSLGQSSHQHHTRCVCQICTCTKHKCPHSHIHIPHQEISSYQKEYIKHPINTWKKPPPEKALGYIPFGSISSSYQAQYPGHKPQMRQKIVPRVKDQSKGIPFGGNSQYAKEFGPKQVKKEKFRNKDRQFNPDNTKFNGSTTYGSDFQKKNPNKHQKTKAEDPSYPENYKFHGGTTYGNDFPHKSVKPEKNYKPVDVVAQKGEHDLGTIYRQSYVEPPPSKICPILTLPVYPKQVDYPSQHVVYNKFSGSWKEK